MSKKKEALIPLVVCPVYSFDLELITLISIPQYVMESLDAHDEIKMEIAEDPKKVIIAGPSSDPEANRINLVVTRITVGEVSTVTFFTEEVDKAMRLPAAFAPGHSTRLSEIHDAGFLAGLQQGQKSKGN